ncbi:MAG: hypothetical protein HY349_05100 [Nitrospirae bacterium]|nr:hypothetical protein [Nitrospirota bacterium]
MIDPASKASEKGRTSANSVEPLQKEGTDFKSVPSQDDDLRLELRIYARRVTWGLVFFGGLMFIGGLNLAGVDLDEIESKGKYYRSDRHICLKTDWLETTVGDKDRAQFCMEWIDPSDTSGNTHQLILADLVIVRDRDGKIRTQHKRTVNYPLIGTILYLAVLIVIGKLVQKHFIEKRRVRLGLTGTTGE